VWDKHDPNRETSHSRWYAVNVVVPQDELMPAVDHLRRIGASTVTVTAVQYAFQEQSDAYTSLLERLKDEP
jgi:ATP phosphoribosyltransferase